MSQEIPEATEQATCPVCGDGAGVVVGEKGRFGMAVRNLCCATCATVYITPRPSAAAMSEYYRSTYRKHYGKVGYVAESGAAISPGEAGYEQALLSWHSQQADNALMLAAPEPGASVLEIGCRHGKTLALMRERRGIVPFGVEPGQNEAEEARRDGIDCFAGSLEEYAAGARRFDLIQCFHVLEHVHEPLAALLELRRLLRPGGRLLLEVPNLYVPYGLLEENFFQNVHLVSYSPSTLPALLRRAGFEVTRVIDAGTLFVLAAPRALPDDVALPLPFARELLEHPEHDTAYVAVRLRSYASLEKLKFVFQHRGASEPLMAALLQTLSFPAFPPALANASAFFVEQLLAQGLIDAALMLTLAVARGPHPADLRREFRGFAERLGASPELLAEAG